jgi:hypothetical protein
VLELCCRVIPAVGEDGGVHCMQPRLVFHIRRSVIGVELHCMRSREVQHLDSVSELLALRPWNVSDRDRAEQCLVVHFLPCWTVLDGDRRVFGQNVCAVPSRRLSVELGIVELCRLLVRHVSERGRNAGFRRLHRL